MATTSKSRQARRKGKAPIGARSAIAPSLGYRQVDLSHDGIAARSHTMTCYVPGALARRLPSAGELRQNGMAPMRKWGSK